MTHRRREPGEFCWINVLTPDPAQAKQFFSAILGWTFAPMPPFGDRIQVDGHDMGGFFDLNAPGTPEGARAVIGVMIRVTDADAMTARVNALGGKALAPMDIGPNGRMVVCHDPSGANFDLWEPKGEQGTDVDGAHHGAFSWFEVLSRDTARDARFYGELFGWERESMPMPGFEYISFKQGEKYVAGMMALTPEMHGAVPWWGTYFTVTDVDAAARAAETLGGRLFMPPMDVEGVGRMCGVISPQGLYFYLMQYPR